MAGNGQEPTTGNAANLRLWVFQQMPAGLPKLFLAPAPLSVAVELGKTKCPKVERGVGTVGLGFMALNFFFK
jgi:hypothetical protein